MSGEDRTGPPRFRVIEKPDNRLWIISNCNFTPEDKFGILNKNRSGGRIGARNKQWRELQMSDYVQMWKDLGMYLENHDLLC